jgi:ABC-type multidrug transport system ATPase subunit
MMLREIIKELRQQNTTILLCTHDMHEADQLCDRIGFMYKGRLAALDTPQALKSGEQQKELVIEYLDNGKMHTTSYALDDPRGAELIHQKLLSQEIISINTKQLTLADIFARITGGELS